VGPADKLPIVKSCFGVIFLENQYPWRIILVHNNADALGPNGEEYKPAGYGIPGGGNRDDYELPYEDEVDFKKGKFGGTVRREVLDEAGIWTEIATRGKNSDKEIPDFGQILFESKLVSLENGRPAINEIYVFHLKSIGERFEFKKVKETNETRRLLMLDLGSILLLPLAITKVYSYREDGSIESVKIVDRNSEGIYFSARERIFGVVKYLGLNLYQLIPDLNDIFPNLQKEKIGWYVYKLLSDAIEKRKEEIAREAKLLEEARARRTKILGSPDEEELLERYAPWKEITPCDLAVKR
jgi:hypothetical protein